MKTSTSVNRTKLEAFRRKCGLSQSKLAQRAGVNPRTLLRIETEAGYGTKQSTVTKIAKALGVDARELYEQTPQETATRPPERHQLNLRIGSDSRNALALIARRYAIKQQYIVAAAPLMFMILAEQSLAERRKNLQQYRDADARSRDIESHLSKLIRPSLHSEEIMDDEEASIDSRDIFAAKLGLSINIRDVANPFADFLTKCLREHAHGAHHVSWDVNDDPLYRIGEEEAHDLLGGNIEAMELVLSGRVALHEMPDNIRRLSSDALSGWVITHWRQIEEELDVALRDLPEILDSMPLDLMFETSADQNEF